LVGIRWFAFFQFTTEGDKSSAINDTLARNRAKVLMQSQPRLPALLRKPVKSGNSRVTFPGFLVGDSSSHYYSELATNPETNRQIHKRETVMRRRPTPGVVFKRAEEFFFWSFPGFQAWVRPFWGGIVVRQFVYCERFRGFKVDLSCCAANICLTSTIHTGRCGRVCLFSFLLGNLNANMVICA